VGCVRIVGRGMVGEVGGTLIRVSIVVVIVDMDGREVMGGFGGLLEL
jgi:hypothetical protein